MVEPFCSIRTGEKTVNPDFLPDRLGDSGSGLMLKLLTGEARVKLPKERA